VWARMTQGSVTARATVFHRTAIGRFVAAEGFF
jgi:hypothetical protein